MNTIKLSIFYFSPALIFFANDIVTNYIRPTYGQKQYGILATILGWMPNYLAGLGFVLLGFILVKLIIDVNKNNNLYRFINIYMILIAAISALGLILWEFEQQSGKLVFDKNDIYASIGGVITGYVLFLILKDFIKPIND